MEKLKIKTVNIDPEKTRLAIEKLKADGERSFSWFVRHCTELLLAGKIKVK